MKEDCLKSLMKQIVISEEDAKKLLFKHNNNIVNCVLDSYGLEVEKPKSPPLTKVEQKIIVEQPRMQKIDKINSSKLISI